ncbi:MAG TPA: oxygen-independent coproporphyrinogen III oxidase [Bacteroidia bacterium]|jgi:oxygen-independent coproporphyrinogen-3 oxidase|nr:oxygen-independent coproporphyrinogen III oxidase [Bacteroidia bacterium]
MKTLIEKYNVPAPRYTSYPTVPYWDSVLFSPDRWERIVKNTFQCSNSNEGISLYIHLPFCESLCTYCGCNTRITVNHQVEIPYLTAVLKEWAMYLKLFGEPPRVKEIHLGGGTPTFFSPENLLKLMKGILDTVILCPEAALSFEGHPNNTTFEHLRVLYTVGFRRISLGIQDFDPDVQHIIHRIQSYESVKRTTEEARAIGYTSVNYDLIYGLPLQTQQSMSETITKVIELRPDRIAFYSYAHVPWVKPGQRKFTEADLPSGEGKRLLYEMGRHAFEDAGYLEIGMDHFSLPDDELALAQKEKKLHRNFMGYTTSHTQLLIGLGVSSISDAWKGFVQNEKKLEDYYKRIAKREFPSFKGHELSAEDLIIRKHILNLMCKHETSWNDVEMQCPALYEGLERLIEMASDGLIVKEEFSLYVTPKGNAFLRNVCMALDARLWRDQPQKQLFSSVA